MVVGNGLIGKKFSNSESENYIIFTSGVSDSNCNDTNEFEREQILIEKYLENCGNKIFVYFSTISIFLKKTPYTEHKKNIEKIIKNSKKKFFIFRIPQIVGNGGNPKNLFNYFKNSVKNRTNTKVYETKRSLIDIDDLYNIVNVILQKYESNKTYNLSGIEIINVVDLIKLFYKFFNEIENFEIINYSENTYPNNSFEIDQTILFLKIDNKNYTKKLINKYANN